MSTKGGQRRTEMKFYVVTKSAGKCGCSSVRYRVVENYKTKAEVRKAYGSGFYGRIQAIYTEAQAEEAFGENLKKLFTK